MFHLTRINFCDFQRLLEELIFVTAPKSSLQRYIEITLFRLVLRKEILTYPRETLRQYITFYRGRRGDSVLSYCLGCSKVAQVLLYRDLCC
jgi:hypothetical protein